MSAVEQGGLSPVKQALFEIRRLKEELAREREARTEPIAVVGVGLRFPGADTPDEFWDLLRAGRDAVGPIPEGRWDHGRYFDPSRERSDSYYVEHGGFLRDVEGFDPEFFGIAPLEAEMMDPQQRLILETAWEALEHAGIPAGELGGSRTGVFVGIATADYHRLIMAEAERVDAYASSGTAGSVAAGRISYLLGLQGPAISVDTACSSSLVAVHLAANSLRAGESDLALAGGVNLMLAPETTVDFCCAGMLSADGRCKTFDAGADGYVRSEGCGVVVLKRLRDAQRDGDRILALVRGSAVNQDGRSSGLTAPNGPAQEAVIAAALEASGVTAAEVGYVEAHGTGTSLGDPIELQALGAVYGAAHTPAAPLYVGSVKTNLGHMEAAAGMAGLIKAMEAVRRGEIPPHLHFTRPTSHIAWTDLPLAVPTTLGRFPAGSVARAGVSSFGFSGTNAHLIVEAPPTIEASSSQAPSAEGVELLVLSAPQEAGLRAVVGRMAEHLGRTTDRFVDVCAAAAAGRTHFPERLVVTARDAGEARSRLTAWLAGSDAPEVRRARAVAAPKVAVHFSGNAGDSAGLQRWAAARTALQAAREIGEGEAGVERSPAVTAAIAAAAHQHAVATLLRSWGIEPLAAVGSGAGIFLAAHHAGLISLVEALRLVILHARIAAGEADAATLQTALDLIRPTAGAGTLLIDSADGRVIVASELVSLWRPRASAGTSPGMGGEAARAAGATLILDLGHGAGEPQEPTVAAGANERVAVNALAEFFLHGGSPRWTAFTGVRPRVTLPTYPFQRRPFWFKRKAAASDGALRGSPWDEAVGAGLERAAVAPVDAPITRYGEVWSALEELTERVGQNALVELGAFVAPEERTLEGVLAAAGIGDLYAPIVKRWLEAMVRRGALRPGTSGYIPVAVDSLELESAWDRVRALLATDRPLLRYLEHTVPLVPGVLGGSVSPLETLFPDGAFEMAADLYENSSVLRYVNGIAAAALAAFVRARPADQPIRVLEVGAGTGGTTSSLVPVLPAERSTYVYTDVSEIFLEFGAAKFAASGIVQTMLFDLERDPVEQGLASGSFDVVVGSNVIHAARDVRAALRRVRSLLAPGGMLLLVESTGHHAWHDVSTGLIEGWQHFADDLRAETPLLLPDVWRRVLEEAGFEAAVTLPGDESVAAVLKQHIVLGTAGAQPVAAQVPTGALLVEATPTTAPPAAVDAHGQGAAAPVAAAAPRPQVARAANGAATTVSAAASSFQERLRAAIGPEREEVATAAVRDCVMDVLRSDPGRPPSRDARLMDLGLDSLMAVRLRNQLQKSLGLSKKLPATLVFDYPSIRQIAMLVTEVVLGDASTESRDPESGRSSEKVEEARAAEVASMSEAEIEAMLDQLHTEGLE